MTDGVVIDEALDVRLNSCSIFNATNDGVRIEASDTGSKLSIQGGTVEGSANLNLNVLDTDSIVVMSALMELDDVYMATGSKFYGTIINLKEGDEGINNLGEFHAGTPELPAESAFGGGDSYTRGMLVYTKTAAGAFVDVSAEARSASSSTFTFPGVAADNAIYVASSLKDGVTGLPLIHHGLKLDIESAGVFGSGEIVVEYDGDESGWLDLSRMNTDAGSPFIPHAQSVDGLTGGFQVRYNILKMNDGTWDATDPMGIGESYHWIRFRIATAITTAPVFQQFKLHPSRGELNSDGFVEFFGNSRPFRKLDMSFDTGKPVKGNMQDQALWLDENIGISLTKNKFTATSDVYGWPLVLPNSLDTSTPMFFRWAGVSSASETIEFTVRWAWQNPDGTMYTTEPVGGSNPNSDSVTVAKAVTLNTLEWFEAELDIADFLARRTDDFPDGAMITVQPTTMTGTFSGAFIQTYHLDWCVGGHAD
jgi:hypothetical protein